MKKVFYIVWLFLQQQFSIAQSAPKPVVVYGAIQKENLLAAPFGEWFSANYDAYQPGDAIVSAIKKLGSKDITIEIFMGTWCGDSKREVPRFYKLLDAVSFPLQQVKLVGLGADSLVKQSPQHEEAGKGIFRVPTFIIYKKGAEINRINEFPVFSLERDFFTILNSQPYEPNYKSFAMVKKWIADGTLLDKNTSTNGLAAQLRPLAGKESELNSLGRLLLEQGKQEEGVRILQINAGLYPESAIVSYSLGEAYHKTGDEKNAVLLLEKAVELNKDAQRLKDILKLLYAAKGLNGQGF